MKAANRLGKKCVRLIHQKLQTMYEGFLVHCTQTPKYMATQGGLDFTFIISKRKKELPFSLNC